MHSTVTHRPRPGRSKDGELRHLMNLTAVGVTLAGVILLSVILYAAWAANSSASAREIALFGNAVNRSILRILNEQKSVAWWDEAYTAVTSVEPNTEFLESEFGIFLSETYGHDIVVILNPENVPIFMYSGGARRSADDYDRYRNVFAPVLAEIRQVKGRSLRNRPDLFGADQNNYRTIGSPLRAVDRPSSDSRRRTRRCWRTHDPAQCRYEPAEAWSFARADQRQHDRRSLPPGAGAKLAFDGSYPRQDGEHRVGICRDAA
jgi:CHASE4 domain